MEERKGWKSPKLGHLGVYFLCTGPDPSGPAPGERLIIVIYNEKNETVRRLEQVKDDCIDPGYIDFFDSFKCRPSIHDYQNVDIDVLGNRTILATHNYPLDARGWLAINVPKWAAEHGIPNS